MDWRAEFNGKLERTEIPEILVDAIRETVINAFAHRHIESGQAIDIVVRYSLIEIYSPEPFQEGLTPEMFIRESLKPICRNPLVNKDALLFKRYGKLCTRAKTKTKRL